MATWGNRNGSRHASEEMMDQQNQQMTSNLSGKVSHLKSLARDIKMDVDDSNVYLGGMDGDFDSSQGLLAGSMNRINHMMGTGKSNRKLMCYIILGLVGLFILIYFIVSHVRG